MIDYIHGGNIYRAAEALGVEESAIIDFSASINPLGVPGSVLTEIGEKGKCLFNYPDPDTKRLRVSIAEYIGGSPDSIICGNGSTELIYLIVRALRPKQVLIPAPTFSEYGRACLSVRCPMPSLLKLKEENNFDVDADEFISAMAGNIGHAADSYRFARPFDMAFLCNPNNPTGRLIRRDDMVKIANAAKRLECTLVVDEAFIDFCPGESVVGQVKGNPFLIVLRSMTKFYALSGLRIGYAILPEALLQPVKRAKEPWTVNTLAQAAGIAALDNRMYRSDTLKLMNREKMRLESGFRNLGISYVASAANYYLLRLKNAREFVRFLQKKGVLVRGCSNFIGLDDSYIRVAVKSEEDNKRLLREISVWVE